MLRWCVSDSVAGLTGGGETLSGTGLTSVDVELKLLTMMVRSFVACYLLAIYIWPNDQYTKPGSGQTQGKLEKPSQARDKHRENSPKTDRPFFLTG